MKSSSKVKRVQLNIDHKNDLLLIGIVSAEPDYKLSLALNRKLGILLRNLEPLRIISANGSELLFSRFSDESVTGGMTYSLVSNRSGKNFLLNKLKNIDYLFIVHEPENSNVTFSIASELKEIEPVNAVFSIDLETFRDKNLHYLTL
jgi:hypothetical protein